ncbi:MAG TPA: M67 family metallopeptidase [Acidimicrobiia bacterium]|nr:M67 family metallopeptidase [Acidimicrobiia bacterium]
MSEVAISADALALVVEHCRAEYPAEVCGFVGARDGVLVRAFPVPNVARPTPGKCGFLMDSTAQFRAMRQMEDTGLELGAIYHSHPAAPAIPSDGDVRLAAYPEAAHLVVSLLERDQPVVRAWQISDGRAQELPLRQGNASDPDLPGEHR